MRYLCENRFDLRSMRPIDRYASCWKYVQACFIFVRKFSLKMIHMYKIIIHSIQLTIEEKMKKKKMTKREIKTPIDCQWCVIFFPSLSSENFTHISFRFILYLLTVNADIEQLMMKWRKRRNRSVLLDWRNHRSEHRHTNTYCQTNEHIDGYIHSSVLSYTQHETHCGKNDPQRFDAMNSN